MSEEIIREVLKNFGLTEKELEIYIFLAKNEPLRGRIIALNLKMQKAQVYRSLKGLQKKGVVQITIESPTRFVAVPFEKVIDLFIKTTHQQAAQIEIAKENLILNWQKINKKSQETQPEKFIVIDGEKSLPRTLQIVKETKKQLSIIASSEELVKAKELGLFDAKFVNSKTASVQFRLITDATPQNLSIVKKLLKDAAKRRIELTVKTPPTGLRLPPRMIIRDEEEILFYISPNNVQVSNGRENAFWTDCKSLVQVFATVFENAWRNSIEINSKVVGNKNKQESMNYILGKPAKSETMYEKEFCSVKKEIIMLTSSEWLGLAAKKISLLRDFSKRGISLKIMAPITSQNINAAEDLSKYCIIRHVPNCFLETTIIDNQQVFQFQESSLQEEPSKILSQSNGTYYSNNPEDVRKAEHLLNDLWMNSQPPSFFTLDLLNKTQNENKIINHETIQKVYERIDKEFLKSYKSNFDVTSENNIFAKIIESQKNPDIKAIDYVVRQYGSAAQAIIHPPSYMNLPDILFYFLHNDKQSTHGSQDAMIICIWMETPLGNAFVPSTLLYDNSKASSFWSKLWAGTPIEKNLLLVRKDQLQIQAHGNTIFSGWTIPIQLMPLPNVLPPSCVLLEGYGEVISKTDSAEYTSGYLNVHESNSLEAFVTFFHPTSKYSGPGTDGVFARESIVTIYPPRK